MTKPFCFFFFQNFQNGIKFRLIPYLPYASSSIFFRNRTFYNPIIGHPYPGNFFVVLKKFPFNIHVQSLRFVGRTLKSIRRVITGKSLNDKTLRIIRDLPFPLFRDSIVNYSWKYHLSSVLNFEVDLSLDISIIGERKILWRFCLTLLLPLSPPPRVIDRSLEFSSESAISRKVFARRNLFVAVGFSSILSFHFTSTLPETWSPVQVSEVQGEKRIKIEGGGRRRRFTRKFDYKFKSNGIEILDTLSRLEKYERRRYNYGIGFEVVQS